MTTTTCDYCDTCAPSGATDISPRVANYNNPPADHSHAAQVNRNGHDWFLYDSNGCDYCDADWAALILVNGDSMLHQFSVVTDALNAYDIARWGSTFGHPRGSDAVRALFRDYMTSYGVWGTRTVNVCPDCFDADAHTVHRDAPVLGVNCMDADARAAMCDRATALGAADRVKDDAARNWRHPKTM